MEIDINIVENFLVVNLYGEIDHHNASIIREKIDAKLEETKLKKLIFNFKEINFMDSSGIGMVIGRYRMLQSQNGVVFVTNLSKEVYRIFDISGLFKIIKGYETVYQCIKENSTVEV